MEKPIRDKRIKEIIDSDDNELIAIIKNDVEEALDFRTHKYFIPSQNKFISYDDLINNIQTSYPSVSHIECMTHTIRRLPIISSEAINTMLKALKWFVVGLKIESEYMVKMEEYVNYVDNIKKSQEKEIIQLNTKIVLLNKDIEILNLKNKIEHKVQDKKTNETKDEEEKTDIKTTKRKY